MRKAFGNYSLFNMTGLLNTFGGEDGVVKAKKSCEFFDGDRKQRV
jgi:hypothetical protein